MGRQKEQGDCDKGREKKRHASADLRNSMEPARLRGRERGNSCGEIRRNLHGGLAR
ncbi:MAG TPA: hypothetical protein VMD97_02665 [Candidatus Aquilonibacter sp.]|nr:hypothetical protein [Candidatus Aquilonibacter sp.]